MYIRWLLVIALLAHAPLALGEENQCKQDGMETFGKCSQRVYDLELERNSLRQGREALASKTTPTEAPGSARALKDFLPRLVAAFGFGDFSDDTESQTLSFGLNSSDSSRPTILKVTRRNPGLFEPMRDGLPQSIRGDRESALSGQLEDFDDVELSLSVNIEGEILGKGHGRNLIQNRLVPQEFYRTAGLPKKLRDLDAWTEILDRAGIDDHDLGTIVSEAMDSDRSKAKKTQEKVIAVAEEAAKNPALNRQILESGRYLEMADLANNQPQLHFEARYRARDELVGPDEWGVIATYEIGFKNLNRLREDRYCKRDFSNFDDGCYEAFTRDNPSSGSNRLAFSGEYSRVDSYHFELPADGFSFDLDSAHKAVVSMAYGRRLKVDAENKDKLRIDLDATYEDVSGDPMRNDRFVSIATLTLDITDNNVATIDLVYANKPEYLGEVDEELSARVGLKFKIDKK